MTTSQTATALFDELDPELVRCPYDLYSGLRSEPPTYLDAVQAVVVTRFDDVQAVISDAEIFSSSQVRGPVSLAAMGEVLGELAQTRPDMAELMEKNMFMSRFLLAADGEDHRRRRSLVQKAFTPRRIRTMESMIGEVVDRLIDDFIEAGEVEFVSAFAVPLPIEVIARAIGVEDADVADFKKWSDALFAPMGVNKPSSELMVAFLQSQDAFIGYFGPRIDERRQSPRDDLLQDLLNAEEEGERLSRAESLLMCAELTAAGNETTTSMLTSAAEMLGSNPELTAELAAGPDLIPGFIEEVLRLEGPIQAFYRTATKDTVVGGVDVPEGTSLLCIYGAANRDVEHFHEADQVRCQRENLRAHVAFGRGPHACVGSLLARTEGRIAVERLLPRIEAIRVVRPPGPGDFTNSYMLRGGHHLELSFRAK